MKLIERIDAVKLIDGVPDCGHAILAAMRAASTLCWACVSHHDDRGEAGDATAAHDKAKPCRYVLWSS